MDDNHNNRDYSKYNQLISQKEREINELNVEQRKLKNHIQNLDDDLHRAFSTLASLNETGVRYGDAENLQMQQHNEKTEYLFRKQLQEINEQFIEVYKKEESKLDETREELYKKRSEISWD